MFHQYKEEKPSSLSNLLTLQHNTVFYKTYDQEWYNRVLKKSNNV